MLFSSGAEILDDVDAFIGRFVAFPSIEARHGVTLWAAHTHAADAFDNTPRLALLSPEPGSGKTRTLEVLELLVPRPMHALNASVAPIFRSIEATRPTLLFDEVDAIFTRRGKDESAEELRGILNAGHRRGAQVPRCVGPRHEVSLFDVFAPAALAGLGDLPGTLMSRSVIVRMRRRAPDEHVTPFRRRVVADEAATLYARLSEWIGGCVDRLADVWPVMPDGISDRPADVWEPLLAIADEAGGQWPEAARAACVALCKVADNRDASLGVRLLADLRQVFVGDRMSTEEILERLHKLEEAPWHDLRGRPLDARGLARRLSAYGIESTKVKIGDKSLRGYRLESLHDAWVRYLPSVEPPEPTEPATSQPMSVVPDAVAVPEPDTPTEPDVVAATSEVPEVPQVPYLRARGGAA